MPPEPDYWQRALEAMRDAALVVGEDGRVLVANLAARELSGYGDDGLVGVALDELFGAAGATVISRLVEDGSEAADGAVDLNAVGGRRVSLLAQCSPLLDEHKNPLGILILLRHAKDQSAELRELRELERRWRSIAENPFDFVVVCGRDYKYQYVNHTAPGIRVEDLLGKMTPFDFVEEAYQADMRTAIETTFATGKASSYEVYVAPLGQWFSNIVGPVFDGDEVTAISILTRDITEAKRAEQRLRDNERRMALALRGSADGLWDMSVDTGEVFYSPRFFELLGYRDGDPELKPHISEFQSRLHPDDLESAGEALRRALEEGEVFDCEYRLRTASGDYRWFNGRGRAVESADGRRFAGFLTDVSVKKKQEEERRALDARLRETHKLQTIGTLAGGIAHDFNNLLTPILGFTQLALSTQDLSGETRSYLDDVTIAAERARRLVQQILTFSRQEEPKARPVDLRRAIDETLRLLLSNLPHSIQVRSDVSEECEPALVDPTQLQQILTNLCTNAAQALGPGGGVIEITVRAVDMAAGDPSASHHLAPGRYVRIVVRDDGPGMPPDVSSRAFEPFFTTKAVGKGTGLGLSVVQGIALSHGGDVQLQSAPGKGTSVSVYLPIGGEHGDSQWPSTSEAPHGNEHVLVVDDEEIVLRVQQRLLQALGYTVTLASSAAEALEKFEKQHESIDLVVTDQAMPGVSGSQLLAELRRIDATIPVVLTTGFSDDVPPERALELGFAAFVSKPNVGDLGRTVRSVLDSRRSSTRRG